MPGGALCLGGTCWGQFFATLFYQLGLAQFPREICGGLAFVFLTNYLIFGTNTVAGIYKNRWNIELFFKTIKQDLKNKTFGGTSKNALLIQIWTALTDILLLKFFRIRSSIYRLMSNLAAMLRYHLITDRDLWLWLDNPNCNLN